MTVVTSAIPLVEDHLIALLQATAPTFEVLDVPPPASEEPREYVCVGNSKSKQQWMNVGTLRRREDVTIEVGVVVRTPGRDSGTTRDRLFELIAAIETVVRANAFEPTGTADTTHNPQWGEVSTIETGGAYGEKSFERSAKLEVTAVCTLAGP